ncbi:MAG: hypothetical protein RL324_1395 [Verrucomicrobiota bacterium]|jgi:hypothetical protein
MKTNKSKALFASIVLSAATATAYSFDEYNVTAATCTFTSGNCYYPDGAPNSFFAQHQHIDNDDEYHMLTDDWYWIPVSEAYENYTYGFLYGGWQNL